MSATTTFLTSPSRWSSVAWTPQTFQQKKRELFDIGSLLLFKETFLAEGLLEFNEESRLRSFYFHCSLLQICWNLMVRADLASQEIECLWFGSYTEEHSGRAHLVLRFKTVPVLRVTTQKSKSLGLSGMNILIISVNLWWWLTAFASINKSGENVQSF